MFKGWAQAMVEGSKPWKKVTQAMRVEGGAESEDSYEDSDVK